MTLTGHANQRNPLDSLRSWSKIMASHSNGLTRSTIVHLNLYHSLDKFSKQQFYDGFLIFPGNNLHERPKPFSLEKKKQKLFFLFFSRKQAFLLCVVVFKGYLLKVLFEYTAAGVKCRVAAVKRLLILHYSADYIFIFFVITEPTLRPSNHVTLNYHWINQS